MDTQRTENVRGADPCSTQVMPGGERVKEVEWGYQAGQRVKGSVGPVNMLDFVLSKMCKAF